MCKVVLITSKQREKSYMQWNPHLLFLSLWLSLFYVIVNDPYSVIGVKFPPFKSNTFKSTYKFVFNKVNEQYRCYVAQRLPSPDTEERFRLKL